jgi:hypothetical protein
MEGLVKIMRSLNHDSHILGRDCNSGPSKCEAGSTVNRRRATDWQKPSSCRDVGFGFKGKMSKTRFLQTAQDVRENVSWLLCEDPNARITYLDL